MDETRRERSPEERAAVLAALMAGQSVSATAREFGIDRSTVIRWRAAAGLDATVMQQQTREDIGELVGELLRTILRTLQVQAAGFGDPEWLKTQPASEAAVLFGVLADKGFRILEAAERAERAEQPDAGPPPGPA